MAIQVAVSKNWEAIIGHEEELQSTPTVAPVDKQAASQSNEDVAVERYDAELGKVTTEIVMTANGLDANAHKLKLAGLNSSVAEGAEYADRLVEEVITALSNNPNQSTQKISVAAKAQRKEGIVGVGMSQQDAKRYNLAPQVPFKNEESSTPSLGS